MTFLFFPAVRTGCGALASALAPRRWAHLLAAGALAFTATAAPASPAASSEADDGQTFQSIALHDVRENARASFRTDPDDTAIDQKTLEALFAWMRDEDWHPVSLQQVVEARQGGAPLPPRAVLLTFDDGYASVYTRVFPLLQRYGYPALLGLITDRLEAPAGQPLANLGVDRPRLREEYATWAQIREMAASGLVELASHSHALHRGIAGNPQDNQQPSAATLHYDARTGRYEDVQAYTQRIESDLRQSRELIEQRTGQRVRAVVWPYGAYTGIGLDAAGRAGMPITLTLDDGLNTPGVPLRAIRRSLATHDMAIPGDVLLGTSPEHDPRRWPKHAMHVDLDYVYDPDPAQQERNLALLVERVKAVGPRSVFLQAFADPDGEGAADALYFPNRALPVRADLFNRAAWELKTLAGVKVHAWMPVMAFQLPPDHPLADRRVQWPRGESGGSAAYLAPSDAGRYPRLTPFDPAVRELIGGIYEDLGRHASFDGLLFHDDALLGDDEDISAAARQVYARWGLPTDIAALRADPALQSRWAAAKTRFLTDFTLALAERTRRWRPAIETARNLYARPVMQPESQAWFAQDYAQSLASYDLTAVMAMPYMEDASDPEAWLAELAARVAATPGGLEKTVFELQARDWRSGRPVPDATLAAQWALLQGLGARHLAYYPDDFHQDQPGAPTLRRMFSSPGAADPKAGP